MAAPNTRPALMDGYFDRQQLARELRVKPRTISEWIAKPNGLPHIKLGKRYFFKVEAVLAWIEGRTRVRNPRRNSPLSRAVSSINRAE